MKDATRTVGIYLFPEVEVLDFCGPFEVFSVTKTDDEQPPFQVLLISRETPVTARNGLTVIPHYALSDHPSLDILLIPGGFGTRPEVLNLETLNWVKEQAQKVEYLLSVCTGSLILAAAGLLDGQEATTHHHAFSELRQLAPLCTVKEGVKYVDNGKVITSAGISAGIEMALHVVRKIHGESLAQKTAQYMEYDWSLGHDPRC